MSHSGCGNSALSHDLHELGYTDVTSIDFSPACIAAMRTRYAHCPGLRWAVMDIRALAFPDAAFDVVLEKGTLDVLMVEETDPWDVSPQAVASMHRVLAEVRGGGSWVEGGSPLRLLFEVGEGAECPFATLLHHPGWCHILHCPAKGHPGGILAPLGVVDSTSATPSPSLQGGGCRSVSLGTLGPAGGLGDPTLFICTLNTKGWQQKWVPSWHGWL